MTLGLEGNISVELKPKRDSYPKCPACGAKFSHDNETKSCLKCGVPDEIVKAGGQAVARWRRHPTRVVKMQGKNYVVALGTDVSKQERKRINRNLRASVGRRVYPHGRTRGRRQYLAP